MVHAPTGVIAVLLWTLKILRDGNLEILTPPRPSAYFLGNWNLVCKSVGSYADIRLSSDGGHVLSPIEGDDVVEFWRVEPQGVVRSSLRAAFARAEKSTVPGKTSG